MNEVVGTIIVAVCGLIGTAIGSFSGMKLMSYRIEQLEKRLDGYNGVADNLTERVYKLEQKDAIQDERIAVLERRSETK